jgi:pilus assembly protein CpaE
LSEDEHNPGQATLAMFTVCADGPLARMAQQAQRHVPGIEFAGEFHDYITADRRPRFPHAVTSASGAVAFIDFDKHADHAVETAEALRSIPSLNIISVGVSSQVDARLLLRAMRAGCDEFLEKPVEAGRFEETLHSLERRFRAMLVPSRGRGRVISLTGAKGGVGATTLAVHVAMYIVKRHGKKTLLIDHHPQLGHVGLHLGLKESDYHFDELIRNSEHLDADLLKGFVVNHSSGLNVVTSSDTCRVQYSSAGEETKQVLQFLRREYDFIVLDSTLGYGEVTAATIQSSDELYLVTTPDIAALRDLVRHVQNLCLSKETAKKLRIVVNRAGANNAISLEQIEQAIGFPVSISIPNNYADLVHALNVGALIPPERNSAFAAQINKLASRICDGDGVAASGVIKSRFSFWR